MANAIKVQVVSFTNGGVPQEMSGLATPAAIASDMGIGLENVIIHVDDTAVSANHTLRDGDLVSFQKEKVASGS